MCVEDAVILLSGIEPSSIPSGLELMQPDLLITDKANLQYYTGNFIFELFFSLAIGNRSTFSRKRVGPPALTLGTRLINYVGRMRIVDPDLFVVGDLGTRCSIK